MEDFSIKIDVFLNGSSKICSFRFDKSISVERAEDFVKKFIGFFKKEMGK